MGPERNVARQNNWQNRREGKLAACASLVCSSAFRRLRSSNRYRLKAELQTICLRPQTTESGWGQVVAMCPRFQWGRCRQPAPSASASRSIHGHSPLVHVDSMAFHCVMVRVEHPFVLHPGGRLPVTYCREYRVYCGNLTPATQSRSVNSPDQIASTGLFRLNSRLPRVACPPVLVGVRQRQRRGTTTSVVRIHGQLFDRNRFLLPQILDSLL